MGLYFFFADAKVIIFFELAIDKINIVTAEKYEIFLR